MPSPSPNIWTANAIEDTSVARFTAFPFWSRTTSRQTTEWRRPRECREAGHRSEEHTSELQSRRDLVCRLLLEKKKKNKKKKEQKKKKKQYKNIKSIRNKNKKIRRCNIFYMIIIPIYTV